jgi:5-methylcytosine-specific restriction endonuclease McrA
MMSKAGANNPNWKGGLIDKTCEICALAFKVKPVRSHARFCSLQCVGVSQRGRAGPSKQKVEKSCPVCRSSFAVLPSRIDRNRTCSVSCARQLRRGSGNPNWNGGLSRLPYPHDFGRTSRRIIERDEGRCHNPDCAGTDQRMTTHHINYDKQDCRDENLIALCSSCNSKANFGREGWQQFYSEAVKARAKRDGGGWSEEAF